MSDLIGRKIVAVRPMTKKELEVEGWDGGYNTVIVLDNGERLYPSQDEEGNGPGCIFGTNPITKESFIVQS